MSAVKRSLCAGGDLSFNVAHVLAGQVKTIELVLLVPQGEYQIPVSCLNLRDNLNRPLPKIGISLFQTFLLDSDCDETLQAIEFANLQLLEFRHIDNRLDANLATTYGMIHSLANSWLPFWHSPARSLRALGELKVEANGLFERTGNVLKLVGDQYLARVYRMLASRFHLEEWERGILRKLDVAEGVYRVVSDQTDTYRAEFLEIVVVLLILLEIILAIFHR